MSGHSNILTKVCLLAGLAPALYSLAPSAAVAAPSAPTRPGSILALEMADNGCTIEKSYADTLLMQMRSGAALAEQSLKTLNEFRKLSDSRPFKRDVPMGQQMTPDEANTFGNLQERLKAQNLSNLFASNRERDIEVVKDMADIAGEMSDPHWSPPPDTQQRRQYLAALLQVMRDKFPVSEEARQLALGLSSKCTLAHAVIARAQASYMGATKIYGLNEASRDLDDLTKRYGEGLKVEALSSADRETFNRIMPVMAQVRQQLLYTDDLIRVSKFELTSLRLEQVRRQALYEAPGDIEHVKAAWLDGVKSGEIDAETNQLSGIVNLVGDHFPSNFVSTLSKPHSN